MKVDYIVVGLGLAGLAFVEELIQANKTFLVFEDDSQTSSLVAGGVYNPVVLKKFTAVWKASEQLDLAMLFYEKLEQKLNQKFDKKLAIKRVFKSEEEQKKWSTSSDNPLLKQFLNPNIEIKKITGVVGNFGFGTVNKTGRIDTFKLVKSYRKLLKENNLIRFDKFEHQKLNLSIDNVTYKDIECNNVVFCEGFGIKKNPFFNYLPLEEAKGELLIIHAPKLNIDFLLKSSLFLIPLGDNQYKVGATFNHSDKTPTPTENGKSELIEKLKKVINVPYKIMEQSAGIRPTTNDRMPFVGLHNKHPKLAVLNGLGTRGVMVAPTMAKNLFNLLQKGEALDIEIDIKRFN
jgi:glycine oxidase